MSRLIKDGIFKVLDFFIITVHIISYIHLQFDKFPPIINHVMKTMGQPLSYLMTCMQKHIAPFTRLDKLDIDKIATIIFIKSPLVCKVARDYSRNYSTSGCICVSSYGYKFCCIMSHAIH